MVQYPGEGELAYCVKVARTAMDTNVILCTSSEISGKLSHPVNHLLELVPSLRV